MGHPSRYGAVVSTGRGPKIRLRRQPSGGTFTASCDGVFCASAGCAYPIFPNQYDEDEKSAFIETLPTGTPEEEAGPAEAPLQQTQRLPALDVLRGFVFSPGI